jgi:hypothetical protein
MKGIICGRDLLPIRLFSGLETTISALKTPILGALIMNNQELTVALPRGRGKPHLDLAYAPLI